METWSLLCPLGTLPALTVRTWRASPSSMPMVLPTLGDSVHLCSSLYFTVLGGVHACLGCLPSPCPALLPYPQNIRPPDLPAQPRLLPIPHLRGVPVSDGLRLGVSLPGGSV